MTDEPEMRNSREIELVRRLDPTTFRPSPEFIELGKLELTRLLQAERRTAGRRRRIAGARAVARAAAAVVGVMAVMAATLVGVDWFRATTAPPPDLSCPDGHARRSGDPAAQCAALWLEKQGVPAPPLAAYDKGTGVVEVRPADKPPPPDARSLGPRPPTPPPRQTTDELHQALGDWLAGLYSRCRTTAEARSLVERHLTRLGLTDWLVVAESETEGSSTCALHRIDHEHRQVTLITGKPAGRTVDTALIRMARRLAARLRPHFGAGDAPCSSVVEAAALVRQEAALAGAVEGDASLVIREVVGDGDGCASVVMLVDERVDIVIRGPAP